MKIICDMFLMPYYEKSRRSDNTRPKKDLSKHIKSK